MGYRTSYKEPLNLGFRDRDDHRDPFPSFPTKNQGTSLQPHGVLLAEYRACFAVAPRGFTVKSVNRVQAG